MFHRSSSGPGHSRHAQANPLRRATDRTRSRWIAAFVLSCVLAVVCGVEVGLTAVDNGLRAAAEQARHRHLVKATTIGEPAPHSSTRAGAVTTTARAQWEFPSGTRHTSALPVLAGTPVGRTVTLWVDDNGAVAPAPRTGAAAATDAVAAGAGSAALIALAGTGVVLLRLRRLEARNLAEWEHGWERVEPGWSGRLRHGREAGDD
ncbi:Rv1733c family protein [Streptomyces yangpuensis]